MRARTLHIEASPAKGSAVALPLVVALVGAGALLAVAGITLGTIPVTVDGQQRRVPRTATIEDLAEARYVRGTRGDLVAVRTGTVLEIGGGDEAAYYRNGRRAAASSALFAGDAVMSADGVDVAEPVDTTTRELAPAQTVAGSGPILEMMEQGASGLVRLRVGRISREELDHEIVRRPVPTEYRRKGVSRGAKVVALTFDDGPWPGYTDRIIRILRRENVKATFFVIGRQARARREIMARIVGNGHVVGNHSQNHKRLQTVSPSMVRWEIGAAQRELQKITGTRPRWFRPPGGGLSKTVYLEAKRAKVRVVMWDVDPWDWDEPGAATLVKKVVSNVKPGSVVLLHDGGGDRTATVQALPYIIRDLKRKGYAFVTLDELSRR